LANEDRLNVAENAMDDHELEIVIVQAEALALRLRR